MRYHRTFHHSLLALLVGLAAFLASFTAAAEDRPIVVIHTFEVHAKAEEFLAILDKAIKTAKKVDPEGGGKVRVFAGHVEPEFASTVTVATVYANMDDYIANVDKLKANPELQAAYKDMQAANFEIVARSINTLMAEY